MPTTRKSYLIALLLLSTTFAAIATPPSSQGGLMLWLKNEPHVFKVKDSSAQRNNGKQTLSAVSTVISNSPSLVSMQDTHQLTLAVWIKPNTVRYEFPVLISKGGNTASGFNGGYELTLNANGDNDLVFYSGDFVAYTDHANGSIINNHLGEWIHVAVVLDTTAQTVQFYANGDSVTNVTTQGSIANVNFNVQNNLYIGAPDPLANFTRIPFDGDMRQVMIFNRALSADEVRNIFSLTRPKTGIKSR